MGRVSFPRPRSDSVKCKPRPGLARHVQDFNKASAKQQQGSQGDQAARLPDHASSTASAGSHQAQCKPHSLAQSFLMEPW